MIPISQLKCVVCSEPRGEFMAEASFEAGIDGCAASLLGGYTVKLALVFLIQEMEIIMINNAILYICLFGSKAHRCSVGFTSRYAIG